ncbi:MAG: hypothetical protein C0410_11225 [Anaerolinea sp.]|nr:hypothetical protein [Anaerolinea sp.]
MDPLFEEEFNKSYELSKEGKFDECVSLLKKLLHRPNLSIKERMMVHGNLGFACIKGLINDPDPKRYISQEEFNESWANYGFAKHLYYYFITDQETKTEMAPFQEEFIKIGKRLTFKFGAESKYFSGKWNNKSGVCEDFRLYKGYPPDYYIEVPAPTPSEQVKAKSGCFIATAAYGDQLAPDVVLFRRFRDLVLQKHATTRQLVALYYNFSPPIADFISVSVARRSLVRVLFLKPLCSLMKLWLRIRERE